MTFVDIGAQPESAEVSAIAYDKPESGMKESTALELTEDAQYVEVFCSRDNWPQSKEVSAAQVSLYVIVKGERFLVGAMGLGGGVYQRNGADVTYSSFGTDRPFAAGTQFIVVIDAKETLQADIKLRWK